MDEEKLVEKEKTKEGNGETKIVGETRAKMNNI